MFCKCTKKIEKQQRVNVQGFGGEGPVSKFSKISDSYRIRTKHLYIHTSQITKLILLFVFLQSGIFKQAGVVTYRAHKELRQLRSRPRKKV